MLDTLTVMAWFVNGAQDLLLGVTADVDPPLVIWEKLRKVRKLV